jgi:hypothetical protein
MTIRYRIFLQTDCTAGAKDGISMSGFTEGSFIFYSVCGKTGAYSTATYYLRLKQFSIFIPSNLLKYFRLLILGCGNI